MQLPLIMRRTWLFLLSPIIVGIILGTLTFGTFVYQFKPIPWPAGVTLCLLVIAVGLIIARLRYHQSWLPLGWTLVIIFTEWIILSLTNMSVPHFAVLQGHLVEIAIFLILTAIIALKRIHL